MKATAEQLGKIDFKKWKEPGFTAGVFTVNFGSIFELRMFRHDRNVASCRTDNLEPWRISEAGASRELCALIWATVDKLEAFITSELAAMKLKVVEKLDWSKLKLQKHREAQLVVDVFPNTDNGTMLSIRRLSAGTGQSLLYRYLKNKEWQAGEHLGGCSETESLKLFACGSKVDAFIASELAAIELAEKRERTKPEPGEGFEYCVKEEATHACIWCPGHPDGFWGPWKPVSHFEFDVQARDYLFSRPKKVEPKLPTVKAPEGFAWSPTPDRNGVCLIAWDEMIERSVPVVSVPQDKSFRDAMAACVAAFDEANGSRFHAINETVVTVQRNKWRQMAELSNGIDVTCCGVPVFKQGAKVRITIEELP